MAKDKGGHGSEAKGHIMGSGDPHGFTGHTARNDRPNAWGQYPTQAKQARKEIRNAKKFQLNKPPSQRRSLP